MERKRMSKIVRQRRGGKITIPAEFRKKLGLTQGSLIKMTLAADELRLRPSPLAQTVKGSAWFAELYEAFAPIREEAAQYSDEEVNAAIEEAVNAVRKKRRVSTCT